MTFLKYKNNQWINIVNPSEEDIHALKKKYKFHDLDLEDCLSETQRPKIDEYDKYLFIILHLPYFSKKSQHFLTEQVNIFIGQNYLITIHNNKLEVLDGIFNSCKKSVKKKKEVFGNSTGYLLY